MTLLEILKSHNVAEADIAAIQSDMKANKIYTSSEENIDIRYGKLKTDHDDTAGKLKAAQGRIAELEKTQADSAGVQDKISSYETKISELEAQINSTKLDAAIKLELLASKAADVDYLTYKLKEQGDLALDDSGKIKGWEEKITALKTQFPTQFAPESKPQVLENRLPSTQQSGGEVEPKNLAEALKQQYEITT